MRSIPRVIVSVDERSALATAWRSAWYESSSAFARATLVHEGELPRQVVGVLDTGVHTLAARRAVDVRGVAGDERAARAVPVARAVVDPERRRPRRVAQPRAAGDARVGETLELLERRRVGRPGRMGGAPGRFGKKKADEAVAAVLEEREAGDRPVGVEEGEDLVAVRLQRPVTCTSAWMRWSSYALPSNVKPSSLRTTLWPPSQPTSHRASTVSCAPLPSTTLAVTPSAVW